MVIINEKKFDLATSELLVRYGRPNARHREDGELAVYRTKNGTLYASFKYWSRETGPQNVSWFEGEVLIRERMIEHCLVEHIEKVFGELTEA